MEYEGVPEPLLFHAPDPGSQVTAEQSGVCGFIRQATTVAARGVDGRIRAHSWRFPATI
jgi:hypothetical protein